MKNKARYYYKSLFTHLQNDWSLGRRDNFSPLKSNTWTSFRSSTIVTITTRRRWWTTYCQTKTGARHWCRDTVEFAKRVLSVSRSSLGADWKWVAYSSHTLVFQIPCYRQFFRCSFFLQSTGHNAGGLFSGTICVWNEPWCYNGIKQIPGPFQI